MSPELTLLSVILIISLLESSWNLYLAYRQREVLKFTTDVPRDLQGIIPAETLLKARVYNLDKITFGIFHSIFDQILGTLMIVFFLLPLFWNYSSIFATKIGFRDSEIITSIIFLLIFNTLNTFISIPFQLYSTFVIEEKHGFNKQTPMFFVKDLIKSYILMQVLIVILAAPMIYIVRAGGQYFFVYLWLFAVFITISLMTVYPDFIAPLFDKYTPLEDGELKTAIEELAASINFPLKKLYVVEGSKRSSHSNAYFYGFYKNKRIVLFDTLLQDYVPSDAKDKEKKNSNDTKEEDNAPDSSNSTATSVEKKGCTNDEVLAILGHELGHWKGNHVLKSMIISQVNLFILFVAFSYLFQYDIIYRAFGFVGVKPVIIGFLIILQFIFTPYHFILSFVMTLLSRKNEFEADAFAKSLGKAEYLRSSLIKLNKDNLGFPVYDWLYSTFNHSHPPLLERLKALNKTE